MPGIADFAEIPNMGVVLLSCITKNATTKAKTTFCSSLPLPRLSLVGDVASAVENVLVAYSATTAAPHEYFDHMGLDLGALGYLQRMKSQRDRSSAD
jgi:hypothetical protein